MSDSPLHMHRFVRPEAETCEHIGAGAVYWSKGPDILRSDTIDGPCRRVARLPRPLFRRALAMTRLGRRLARETFYNVMPLSDGSLFYTYAREAGFITRDGAIRPLRGLARAHRVLRGGASVMPDDSVVFGEYFDNPQRDAVRIYRATPQDAHATEIYRFGQGEVRHIHSVRRDPFTRRTIVCTGDLAHECRILSFAPDFSDCTALGEGSEDWRTISPQFSAKAIYFGTDAQFAPNRLLRFDRATKALTTLAEVNGPVFYSAAVKGGWVFATTAELCPSQTSPHASLYHLEAATEEVRTIASFRKDCLPNRYFQHGILNLPIMERLQNRVPISGVALKGFDATFRVLEHG
ncbi:hypothetical protein [Celeribacter sp.]|uniref:hypothetical protein n=1 Tax=Celeribacter sp. TaxID=1890673 RepID=UPI003A93B2A6